MLGVRRLIREPKDRAVGIFIDAGAARGSRVDPNIVTRNAGHERAVIGDRPLLDVRFEEVGMFADELCAFILAALLRGSRRRR